MNVSTRLLFKFAAYAIVYLGVPMLASSLSNETARSVLGIVYLFLLIPCAIVKCIDYYKTNAGGSFISRLFNVLFRVPLALFGLLCLLGGLSIIGWVLYNVCVQRQKQYTGPHWIIGIGSFGFGVPLVLYGWGTIRSAIRRQEKFTLQQHEFDELAEEEGETESQPENSKNQ